MPYNLRARLRSRTFIRRVRRLVRCATCGQQPVDFHNPAHEARPQDRVAKIASQGFPLWRIKDEIRRATPLCRRCHMAADGRLQQLTTNNPYPSGFRLPPRLCSECRVETRIIRRGLCRLCYDRRRAHAA